MIEVTFKNRKMNTSRLIDYGFTEKNNEYIYISMLADGQMKLTIHITSEGKIRTEMIDNEYGEEYVLHGVAGAAGAFVGRIKMEYAAVLDDIADKCFDIEVFQTKQAKEIISYVCKTYGDELEFLWAKFAGYAIWGRKDNKKWYGVMLTVKACKLGISSDESVEILDLRINPDDMESTIDKKRFFPGYHMNKKHWYTILLDGSVDTKEICERIDKSYILTKK